MLSQDDPTALRANLRGSVLSPGEPDYEHARAVWNGMIDKRPGVIVQCAGVADVMTAVNFAREAGLPLSVKAGGHNVAGKAVCDAGVMIDMSRMNQVRIDPSARRCRAAWWRALWADFDHEAQAFGLTCTGGVVSNTGVAGLTLGGGIGYLTRSYGLACDNLVAADVVTAGGELLHAGETENPELLWALRGGGGNFGVVTSLEFRLHEVGPQVASATVFHAIEAAPEVLRFYRDYSASAPDEVACYAMIVNAPPDLPETFQGRPVLALVACYSGAVTDGLRLLEPLGQFGQPIAANITEVPYKLLQTAFDAGNPKGGRYYWKSQHLTGLPDDMIDATVRFANDLHGSLTIIGIEPLGGAQGRVAPDATAFAHRDVPYSFGIWTGWTDAADDAANIAWTPFEAVQPFGAGAYVNYLGEDEGDRLDEPTGTTTAAWPK
ncbi:MAG: FAD-binding oxidoreductase [Pseudomonadales bacterium]